LGALAPVTRIAQLRPMPSACPPGANPHSQRSGLF
jgi:hypothetical protein